MNIKEIWIHRMRDFESILHSKRKTRVLTYVLLRQIFKLLRLDEKIITKLIPNNLHELYGLNFISRAKTLDFLFFSKFYEPETTRFLMNTKGGTFIDVGSHIGRFALIGSKRFKKVLAFEPHPSNFKSLQRNVEINSIKNIKLVQEAVSDKPGSLKIGEIGINTGATQISESGTIIIKANNLDNTLKKYSVKSNEVDLIMIDAEGYELNVLMGCTRLLKMGKPTLIIECFDLPKVREFLRKYGYENVKQLDFYNQVFTKKL